MLLRLMVILSFVVGGCASDPTSASMIEVAPSGDKGDQDDPPRLGPQDPGPPLSSIQYGFGTLSCADYLAGRDADALAQAMRDYPDADDADAAYERLYQLREAELAALPYERGRAWIGGWVSGANAARWGDGLLGGDMPELEAEVIGRCQRNGSSTLASVTRASFDYVRSRAFASSPNPR